MYRTWSLCVLVAIGAADLHFAAPLYRQLSRAQRKCLHEMQIRLSENMERVLLLRDFAYQSTCTRMIRLVEPAAPHNSDMFCSHNISESARLPRPIEVLFGSEFMSL